MQRKALLGCVTSLVLAVAALAPAAASAWAPASSATVHPGVMTVTRGAQCTSNFVFQNGTDVYLGQNAHCASTSSTTEINGCEAETLGLSTPVEIEGASRPGTMVYSSWVTMQANGESNPNTCTFNDFALVRINPADVPRVNPSVPGFGGPTGLGSIGGLGSEVYTYGNSSLRAGISPLSPKQGVVVSNEGGGWSHKVYTVTPGIFGDSGSGVMNGSGQAFGVLSTIQILPLVGSNGVSDLPLELAYMRAHSSLSGTQLVPGTEPFTPDLLGAILGA
jgi:hypothetical protein